MNKLDKPLIETVLDLNRNEIGMLDPAVIQFWLQSLAQEILELRRELEENHNCCDVGCPCCGM